MIKSLKIRNIQSHKDSELEFDPGVNVIVGDTDSGKSTILKSIQLVVKNRPSGNDIRSWWGGKSLVKINTEEGSVTRIKDKIEQYLVSSPESKLSLKAFGRKVPEEVSNLLRIGEVNLQQQLDNHFLLSKSSGDVAAYLNKIAKLDEIDLSTANIKKKTTSLTQDIKYNREQRNDFKKQLISFSYLDKFEMEVEALEEMEKRVARITSSEKKLSRICDNYDENRIEIDSHSRLLEMEKPLNTILELIEKKENLESKNSKLTYLISGISHSKEKLQEAKILKQLNDPLTAILKLYKEKEKVVEELKNLNTAISNLSNVRKNLKTAKTTHKDLCIKFNNTFPQKCPLCGRDIPHDKMKKL